MLLMWVAADKKKKKASEDDSGSSTARGSSLAWVMVQNAPGPRERVSAHPCWLHDIVVKSKLRMLG
jgi:hypothetical protein